LCPAKKGRWWRRIKGTGSSQGLSPLKFKMGVKDKSPTPIYSPLILIPITATIRTQQILFVITVLLNIVSCQEREMVEENKRERFEPVVSRLQSPKWE